MMAKELRKPAEAHQRHSLTVRLDDTTQDWLEAVAKRNGVGTSTMARMLILKGLAQEGPPAADPWVKREVNLS